MGKVVGAVKVASEVTSWIQGQLLGFGQVPGMMDRRLSYVSDSRAALVLLRRVREGHVLFHYGDIVLRESR